MRFIEKFKNKFSYNFIVGVIAAGFLCSVEGYGATVSDADLEGRIAEKYRGFGGLTPLGAQQSVCRALQFVWSLADSADPDAGRMIAMILRDGRGVGGIDTNRSANEAEIGVYYSLIGNAKARGVSRQGFQPTVTDTTTVVGAHQRAVVTAYEVISDTVGATGASGFVNYVRNREAFRAVSRDVNVLLAVRHSDWEGWQANFQPPPLPN